jgi:eukaryotic-like serine/threonine-protein kinase
VRHFCQQGTRAVDKLAILMSQPVKSSSATAGNDASFAATVVEELFIDAEETDSEPAVDPGDTTLQMMPTLSHVGRYELKHQLGTGGLGTVYAALDPLLSRQVAVKMLQVAELHADARSALESQLLAEARAAAGLAHPNIVTVYDAGLAEEGVYIAMERLQGKDVRHLLADGWRPEAVQAARIGKRLADALAYAHGKGVVHCDVKPANVFMVGRTQPKVLDFGIARVTRQRGLQDNDQPVDIDTGSLGAAAAEGGSPYYVSPEQLLGEELDARADVYGVGVVLYEMLTGERAFAGDSLDALRDAVLSGHATAVHVANPKVGEGLSAIVARAMARKPGDRYRSARQLSRALRTWISEETNGVEPVSTARRSNAWIWAAGAMAVAGVLVAIGWRASQAPAGEERVAAAASVAPSAAPAALAPMAVVPPVAAAPASAALPAARPDEAQSAAAEQTATAAASPASASASASAPDIVPEPAVPTKPSADNTRTQNVRAAPRKEVKPKPPVVKPAPAVVVAPTAPPTVGQVQLAVTPWGNVEVDGRAMGTTPPLTRLSLPVGPHQIVVRNGDLPAFTASVDVSEDKPVTLRHRFE